MPRYELIQKRKEARQVWRELPEGSRVVIYGRHSPGETQTILSQADAMRRWAETRRWCVEREFYDEGIEGSRSDRPAFQDMLRYLRQEPHPADGVITWNTMRFGRDQLDSQFYKADLRRRGYVVLGKEDGIEQSPLAPVARRRCRLTRCGMTVGTTCQTCSAGMQYGRRFSTGPTTERSSKSTSR